MAENQPPEENYLQELGDAPILQGFIDNPFQLLQFSDLTPGEELVILHTNHGDITLRFFPEEAPLAVENFLTHARNGFYDGLTFHRVIPNFMIQGGCPKGTGTGGTSIWGHGFDTEPSYHLRHFRGALAMAHAGPGTIGSQFYIVQNNSLGFQHMMEFQDILAHQDEAIGRFDNGTLLHLRDIHPAEEVGTYLEHGGTPHLDWHNSDNPHTVFGHAVWGMDVIDEIANTPTGANNRPVEDITINGFSFFTVRGGV